MKHLITTLLLSAGVFFCSATEKPDTIHASDFGALPDTYTNCTTSLQKAIDACRRHPGAVLALQPGRYDIWPEGAVRKEIYISNTSSETECPDKTKIIGLHFNGLENIEVAGNGASLIMHGKLTPIAIDSCRNIRLQDLTIDFERPGGSELTYLSVQPGKVTLKAGADSRYDIRNGKLNLIGEGWRSNRVHCIKFTPSDGHMRYSGDWGILAQSTVTDKGCGILEFETPEDFTPETGATLTLRDIIRDQVGMLLLESDGIELTDINVRYMHGLGIVSQYSRNITMRRVNCRPDEHSGRILASSADFMHFSGCSGHIEITGCNYSGAHDDAINVHGTNLRAVKKLSDRSLQLRFMHHQTYGFMAYHPGDTVAFVNPATMLRTTQAVVTEVKRDDPRNLTVTFDRNLPSDLQPGSTCVENLTCTPTLHVSDCSFTRLSTRGILATTPRRVVIENNTFTALGMAAILIEGDAEGWYESDPVTDVTIRNNTFTDCGYAGATSGATIAINPSNTIVDNRRPVHYGISITGNSFFTAGRPVLKAKSTANLSFTGNTVSDNPSPEFILDGCRNITISGNNMDTPKLIETNCAKVRVK
ncbi:MAG: right-handed parallel beta-helix repeat-containing protein [Muribaculaceae bacterium]|nr:right-handed parallel beta-helix repeat-containing protein [Muribaculaceae bacterium]